MTTHRTRISTVLAGMFRGVILWCWNVVKGITIQIAVWIAFGIVAIWVSHLRRKLLSARLRLGAQMYQQGIGRENVLFNLRRIDDQLSRRTPSKVSRSQLRQQKRQQLLKLTSDAAVLAATGQELSLKQKVRRIKNSLSDYESRLDALRARIAMPMISRRGLAIVLATILIVLVVPWIYAGLKSVNWSQFVANFTSDEVKPSPEIADTDEVKEPAPPKIADPKVASTGTGTTPSRPRATVVPIPSFDKLGFGLIRIPFATFVTGSPEDEIGRNHDLEVQQLHNIDQPFDIGRTEVTRRQYWSVMDPSHLVHADEANLPIVNVTWHDAMKFCDTVSTRYKIKCRLPTEWEWEYCCRAGNPGLFGVAPDSDLRKGIEDARANDFVWLDRRTKRLFNYNSKDSHAKLVATEYSPNRWGIFDMHGNVWEWCATDAQSSDDAPTLSHRPTRGGSWSSTDCLSCRSASRAFEKATTQKQSLGFRIVIETSASGSHK